MVDFHILGLHYFAEGLKDVGETLEECEETEIAKKLEKFIKDLVECTVCKSIYVIIYICNYVNYNYFLYAIAQCTNFIIDVGFEILILYERIYEIYGDILAATNSFGIKAYEMGEPVIVH